MKEKVSEKLKSSIKVLDGLFDAFYSPETGVENRKFAGYSIVRNCLFEVFPSEGIRGSGEWFELYERIKEEDAGIASMPVERQRALNWELVNGVMTELIAMLRGQLRASGLILEKQLDLVQEDRGAIGFRKPANEADLKAELKREKEGKESGERGKTSAR